MELPGAKQTTFEPLWGFFPFLLAVVSRPFLGDGHPQATRNWARSAWCCAGAATLQGSSALRIALTGMILLKILAREANPI